MQSRIKDKIIQQLTCDTAAMLLSLFIAFLFGHKGQFSFRYLTSYQYGIITLLIVTFCFLIIFDAYSVHRTPSTLREPLQIGLAILLSAISTTFVFFFFRDTVPRAVFIIFYAYSFMLIVLLRHFVNRDIRNKTIKVLIVGGGERCAELARMIRERTYLHTEVVGYLSDDVDSFQ